MKTALITSGGGAKGAFTIGVLSHLRTVGKLRFDYVSGTSTGALLATFACLGDLDTLRRIYTSVGNDDILQKQNLVDNFLHNRPYIFSTEPLTALISQQLTPEVYARIMAAPTTLCLTAISLQTGRTTIFSTKPLPTSGTYANKLITSREALLAALQASSNQAGFLPPVTIDGEQYVDGGNREVLPTLAIPLLRPDRIIAISNNPRALAAGKPTYTGVLDVIMRAISIFVQEVRENDIAVLDQYSQQTGAQYLLFEPDRDLDPAYPTGLRFDQLAMTLMMAKGEATARALLARHPEFLT